MEIPALIREWREPKHAEFGQMPKTGWRLFNAATEVIKGDLWRLPARTRKLHTILDDTCGLQVAERGSPAVQETRAELVV
jgi:hypothetical protein